MTAPTITLTSVSVQQMHYDEDVLSIASDYLNGYSGDYYFFQYAIGDYVLLYDLDNAVIDEEGLSCDGCQVVEFKIASGLPLIVDEYQLNLLDVGTDAAIYRGTARQTHYTNSYKSYSVYYSGSVSVSRNDYVVYSSAENYPHLIQGVENYAFIAVCIAIGVICFKLFDRLFRRIY